MNLTINNFSQFIPQKNDAHSQQALVAKNRLDSASAKIKGYRISANASLPAVIRHGAYRLWNAVKAIFGKSDWQAARQDLLKPVQDSLKKNVVMRHLIADHLDEVKEITVALADVALCLNTDKSFLHLINNENDRDAKMTQILLVALSEAMPLGQKYSFKEGDFAELMNSFNSQGAEKAKKIMLDKKQSVMLADDMKGFSVKILKSAYEKNVIDQFTHEVSQKALDVVFKIAKREAADHAVWNKISNLNPQQIQQLSQEMENLILAFCTKN